MNSFRRSSGNEALAPEIALEAAKQIYQKAQKQGKKAAVAGGLAMQIFGFTRATKDVDLVASSLLNITSDHKLDFGGEVYLLQIQGKDVEIDWIVRNDDKKLVYDAALENAEMTDHGFPIITPEWMVLLKYLSGRGKDEMDLMWLLREEGLVDRDKVIKIVEELMGTMAFWAKEDLKSVFLEADFLNERDKN